MTPGPELYYGTLGLLLAADVAYGRRRLLPYMASLLVSSLAGETDLGALSYVASFVPMVGLAFVLWRRLKPKRHVAVILGAVAFALLVGAGAGTSPSRQLAWTGAEFVCAAAVVHAYLKPARLAITTPLAVDLSMLSFAAFDGSIGLAAGAELLGADVALASVWTEILWIQAALFVTLAAVHQRWRDR